jgi:hypothetical protein
MRHRAALLAVLLFAAPASAQPLGPAFRVNTTTAGTDQHPAVHVHAASEGFVVVWTGLDGGGNGILGQRFSSAGVKLGGEFRVNATTSGSQFFPAIAGDALGRFVVVWESSPTAGESDIFGQRFGSAGEPLGPEFRVSSGIGEGLHPGIAMTPDGRFAVVFREEDGAGTGIFARIYSALGAPEAAAFRVNSYVTGSQVRPVVAGDAGGRFIVAWVDISSRDGDGEGVYARRVSWSGVPIHEDFQASSPTTGVQSAPSVAMERSGAFFIAWQTDNGVDSEILARQYSSTGAPQGVHNVSGSAATPDEAASVGASPAGEFVVAWDRFESGTDRVLLRRYSFGGAASAIVPRAHDQLTSDAEPSVSVGTTTFVVAYRAPDGSSTGIFAQRYRRGRTVGDANGDGLVDVLDVFHLINFLFAAGPPPA